MLQNKDTLVLELRSHSRVIFMPEITITFMLENKVAFVLEITETKDSEDGGAAFCQWINRGSNPAP